MDTYGLKPELCLKHSQILSRQCIVGIDSVWTCMCVCCQCVITATVQPSDSYIDSYIVRFPLLYHPLLLGLSRHGYAGITFESGHR